MIISRTPLRISFLGGGSDYPQFYMEHGGAILGTSIDKYCYVGLHTGKSWRQFDLPNRSGLASSSAYTVGLLRVCTQLDKVTIAQLATVWEQDKMGGMVGSQDQYLCAVGGFHHLKFNAHGITDIPIQPDVELENYLMLFDMHQYRTASNVISHQLEHMNENIKLIGDMRDMVKEGIDMLRQGDYAGFGELLGHSWMIKRELSKYVSTPSIDDIYSTGLKAGAIGGKLLGGGGGGFFLFLVEPAEQLAVREALQELTYVPFKFETLGTEIILQEGENNELV